MKPQFNNRSNKVYKIDGQEIWESRSPAVVAVLFGITKNGTYVLSEKRSQNMQDEPGKWVLASGYIDWDESGWDALIREVYEETSFYMPNFEKYLIHDNNKTPFFVNTDPSENRQNVALSYLLVYDFKKKGLPRKVESYKDSEIEKVKWINFKDIFKYTWAFSHDKRIINGFYSYQTLENIDKTNYDMNKTFRRYGICLTLS